MKRRNVLVAVAVLLIIGALRLSAQPAPTSIYVFTSVASADSPTDAERERLTLVENLKKSLPDNKKISAQVTVTELRESATVIIEVTRAEKIERITPALGGQSFVSPSYRADAKLTFGTYSTDFASMSAQDSYKRMANVPDPRMDGPIATLLRFDASTSLTGKVHDWIATNQDELRKKQ